MEPNDEDQLLSGPMVSKFFSRMANAQIARQLAIAAIALERYKLAESRYPANARRLVAPIHRTTPRDPIDGKPLRYRLEVRWLIYALLDRRQWNR